MAKCRVCDNCKAHKRSMNTIWIDFDYGWKIPRSYDVCNKKCGLELIKKKTKNWGKWWA